MTRTEQGTDTLTAKFKLNEAQMKYAEAKLMDGYERGIDTAIEVLQTGITILNNSQTDAATLLGKAIQILESKRGQID